MALFLIILPFTQLAMAPHSIISVCRYNRVTEYFGISTCIVSLLQYAYRNNPINYKHKLTPVNVDNY